MSFAPGPDGRHDDLDAAELEGLALLVPDDARSLDPDRDAYLRERRGEPRHGLGVQSYLLSHFGPAGLSAPLVLVVIVVVGIVAGSVAFFTPAPTDQPSLPPLATNATASAGQVDGLLPNVTLALEGTKISTQALRPATIAMVPTSCGSCGNALRTVLAQAREFQMTLILVGPPAQTSQLQGLDRTALGGAADVAVDPQNTLASVYQPSGVTLLLVHSDGVLGAIVSNVGSNERLETKLSQLQLPGAPSPSS